MLPGFHQVLDTVMNGMYQGVLLPTPPKEGILSVQDQRESQGGAKEGHQHREGKRTMTLSPKVR